jgi:hypothetical protein
MITAWSYSRWRTYTTCPSQAKYKFIDKLKEDEGPALVKGKRIHTECELYLTGRGEITPAMMQFEEEFSELYDSPNLAAEQEWAYTREWAPSDWFAPTTWCRVKLDAKFQAKSRMTVIDFKTGKIRPIDEIQLTLYALGAFMGDGKINEVETELWYLDHGEIISRTFKRRTHAKGLQRDWEDKTKPMLSDTEFKPAPGNHCRWCSFAKSKGGPCEEG